MIYFDIGMNRAKKDSAVFMSMVAISVLFIAAILTDNIYTTIKPRPQIPIIDIAQLLKTFQKTDLQPIEAKYYKVLKRY